MALVTESVITDLCLAFGTLFCVFYYYLTSSQSYWKNRGVPYVKPQLFFGSSKDMVFGNIDVFKVFNNIYKQLEGEKFGGYFEFTVPNFIVRDPKLIEHVLVKDFTHFMDRGFGTVDPIDDPLSTGLPHLTGEQWRNLRYKLTPTFTSGKLKGMFDQISNCCEDLLKKLKECSLEEKAVDTKTILSSFTSDVIATCAFGVQFSSDCEKQVFQTMSSKLFTPSVMQLLKLFTLLHCPRFAKFVGLRMFSKDVNDYFLKMTKDTIQFRGSNNVKRNDFLQLLLSLREDEKRGAVTDINKDLQEEDSYLQQKDFKPSNNSGDLLELTDEVIAAQTFLFLGAGSDTVSNTLSLTLYCIAANPKVQQRVQQEIDEVSTRHGQWSYSSVKDMVYLDQVIQESMRVHPFSPALQRVCTSPYKVPGSDIVLEKGQRVVVPVYPVHMDPFHYPNPETFDPERFKGNNYRSSSTYLPFGDGPRMCIAMRFAVLEMKVCLARVLSQYSVTVNDKTVQPIQLEPRTIIPVIKGGIWLNFHQKS